MQDMMIHADLQMLSERSQAKASLYNMDPFLKIRIMETNVQSFKVDQCFPEEKRQPKRGLKKHTRKFQK